MNKMNFLPVFELKTLIFELQHNITLSLEIKKGDNTEKIRTQEKKTEHTNISRSSQKLRRQNIHVMLSYAKIPINLQHPYKHKILAKRSCIMVL